MKVLITGVLGNVGKHVVNELINKGEKIVAGDIDIDKIKNLFGDKVDAIKLDFTDKKTFDKALEGLDRVFLMRPPHLGKPEDLYPFIDAMKFNNIKLVSFLSLMGVEKNLIPPHYKIEKYIEKVGLAIATLLHEPEKYKNTAHTITGPEALDYYQIAEILSEVIGKKITYKNPSFLKYRNYYIKKRGLDKEYVNVTVALYFMTRLGTAEKVTDEFYKLTGKKPKTFREFASDNINCFI
ncbi:Uncharacterized conserved protein YbjT, contains NAD(P)-binding and DUF2867 domains [Alkalithermobacter thermoalcaliphilus JW-YL-7 = DSM 7308]|uniref:NmrA family protein n=1 Tax=Alkalithermobacter thermoalcaliphilus JW-YL-7 = DSM 7308 TaxID=1121328 RepID=A0A150FNM0_CLOPD|nr:NmrA family protein [[Clostridium] paradoxum JW-YL-7 = DSM 7308]SHK87270.1 Uncharacterized conserved protein YbjT, contains NAD(P)-binding and DUF2867 domains [[Clostridium] paradoxum JW-YL-7 = DSM 7308]